MFEQQTKISEGMEPPEGFTTRKREMVGFWSYVVTVISVAAVSYQLYYAVAHPFFALEHRAIHWLLMSSLIFLIYPGWVRKGKLFKQKPSVLDIILLLISAGILIWIFTNAPSILARMGIYLTSDVIIGIILIILVLEACRRTLGLSIPIIAIVFLLYALLGPYLPGVFNHAGYSIERLSTYLSLTTEGIFGIPMGVSANFIFLFILYGAILRNSGGGKFFTDMAFALTGGMVGGPAKAAVTASTFFGMISGSSVANTTTTGTITIPLMKKAGYADHFAGGVEASASTIGQIMPPVMGAAAFIMAEFLGIPYLMVVIAAIIPASLAFFALFMQVHYKSLSLGLKPEPKTISMRNTLASGWHHLIAITVLVALLGMQFSPERAITFAIITQVLFSSLRKHTRMSPRDIVNASREGAIGSVEVAAAVAAVGIIIGSITTTGLGLQFSAIIADISRGSVLIALPLVAVASLVLGMGVPTTAQYIIISSLVAPALVQLGILAIAAHLFILYWGTRADITPPVCVAAYAAAGIAKANPMKTGISAFRLGLAGYIIPFMFVFNTGLLLKGSPGDIVLAILVAIVGVTSLASAVQNHLFIQTTMFERILLFAIPLISITPIGMQTLVILPLLGVVLISQKNRQRN